MSALPAARTADARPSFWNHVQVLAAKWMVAPFAMRFLRVVVPPARELVVFVIQSRACVQVAGIDARRVVASVAGFLAWTQLAPERLSQYPARGEDSFPSEPESPVAARIPCAPPGMARCRPGGSVREGLESLRVGRASLDKSHVIGSRIAGLAPSRVMCSAVPARMSLAGTSGDRTGCHGSIISDLNTYRRFLSAGGTANASPVTAGAGQ